MPKEKKTGMGGVKGRGARYTGGSGGSFREVHRGIKLKWTVSCVKTNTWPWDIEEGNERNCHQKSVKLIGRW